MSRDTGPQYLEEMHACEVAIRAHLGAHASADNSIMLPLYYRKSTQQFHVYTNHALKMRGMYVPKELFPDAPGRLLVILKPL